VLRYGLKYGQAEYTNRRALRIKERLISFKRVPKWDKFPFWNSSHQVAMRFH
jgi:hypothetical protein